MRLFIDSEAPVIFRRGGVIAMLAALMLSLAACSTAKKSELIDGLTRTAGQTAPLIVLRPVEGFPSDKALSFATAMVEAARQREISMTAADHPGGNFTLVGEVQAVTEVAGVRVVYQWWLLDYAGATVHSAGGSESAGLFTGKGPWDAVTPTTLERIAQTTADSLAAKLGQLGFGTRVASINMPPPDYFVPAGDGAEREVDMALLDGAGALTPSSDPPPPEADDGAAALPAASEPYVMDGEPAGEEEDPVPQQDGKGDFAEAEAKPQIRAVAVLPVRGAGAGDAELTEAMRRTLRAAGWPVVSEARPDAIIVAGLVRISDPQGGEQNVSLRWDVKTPAGSPLGDVKQSNKVPAGSFDAGWGSAATDVAEAAASGIFDIVERFR